MNKTNKIRIIAEAGVNHNGNYKNILKLIDIASKAKSDYVKFQITNSNLISKSATKAAYQLKNTDKKESQKNMIKKLEFDWDKIHPKMISYCRKKNIKFLTSAFDEHGLEQINKLKLKIFKVPSGEITNLPYLKYLSGLNGEIILSTGMANLKETEIALNILNKNKKHKITVMHCNTAYPTPFYDANLRALETLKKEFGFPIGFSDHTLGIEASIAAVAMGASIIEKHFTINKRMKGPDHQASLSQNELISLVNAIRNIELAMGTGKKVATVSEKENINVARKSIVAKIKISKGQKFTEDNIAIKRPGNGISPYKFYEIIGKRSKFDFEEDDLIKI